MCGTWQKVEMSHLTPEERIMSIHAVESFSTRSYDNEFEEHPDIVISWAVNQSFVDAFKDAFTAYIEGDWAEAKVSNQGFGGKIDQHLTSMQRIFNSFSWTE